MIIELLKGYLDQGEWHTLDEIYFFLVNIQGLFTSKREIRRVFHKYNLLNQNGDTETFIAHSPKGYQLTRDENLIRKSVLDDKKRALKLLKRYCDATKRLGEREQISLQIGEERKQVDLYEIMVAFNES